MLTGRLPFEADTPWQWATEHMMSQPMPFEAAAPTGSGIPEQMRAAIMRALSKDRDDRQSDVAQFLKELTGEAPVPAVVSGSMADDRTSTGTAAMEAAPDFGASSDGLGTAKTAAMPAATAVSPGGRAGVPAAPAPPASGGGKGLVVGLGGAAAVLLVGIVVVAMGNKSGDEDAPPPPATEMPSGAGSTIAPALGEEDPAPSPEPTQEATDPGSPSPSPSPSPTSAGPKASPKPAAGPGPAPSPEPAPTPSPEPAPAPAPAPKPKPPPPPPPTPQGDQCAACASAARAGNIAGAASAYRNCSDAAKKAYCQRIVNSKAPGAAKSAAFNGNCPAAKAIVAAANGMGAGSSKLNAAVSSCN
jgi:serine/threonine-protein kinase